MVATGPKESDESDDFHFSDSEGWEHLGGGGELILAPKNRPFLELEVRKSGDEGVGIICGGGCTEPEC